MTRRFLARSWYFLGQPLVWYWVGLVLAYAALYVRLGSATPVGLDHWFNGDTLFPVHVYTDVVLDGYRLAGWKFPIAPFVFPDVVLASVCMMVCGQAALAAYVYGIVQVTLLTMGFHFCCRTVGFRLVHVPHAAVLAAAIGLTLLTAYDVNSGYPEYYNLFLPQSHSSTWTSAIWTAGLGLWLLRHGVAGWRGIAVAALYAILVALATLGNLLFCSQLVLAFSLAASVAAFLDMVPWRRLLVPLVLGWGSAGLGLQLGRICFDSGELKLQAGFTLDRFERALDVFLRGFWHHLVRERDWYHWSATLWLLLCGALLLLAARRQITRQPGQHEGADARRWLPVLLCFLFCSALCNVAAIVLGGHDVLANNKNYDRAMRYLHPFFVMPFFGWAILLAKAVTDLARSAASVAWALRLGACAAVAAPLALLLRSPAPLQLPHRYVPALVGFLDDHAEAYGLSQGLTGFWTARLVTLFSSKGLRAYQIHRGLEPMHWLGNQEWYTGHAASGKPPHFTFVITDGMVGADPVVANFGQPATTLEFGNQMILIYNRPSDGAFQDHFFDPWQQIGHRVFYPASQLASSVGFVDGDARVARQGITPEGALTFGPYARLPAGTYRIVLQLDPVASSSSTSVAHWDVGFFDRQPEIRMGMGEIGPGMQEIAVPIVVDDQDRRPLEMRVFYHGKGSVGVKGLHLVRER